MASPSSPTPCVGERRESAPFYVPTTPEATLLEIFNSTGDGTENLHQPPHSSGTVVPESSPPPEQDTTYSTETAGSPDRPMYIRDDEPLTQLNAERVESIPGLDDENKNNRTLLAQHKLTHAELQEIECLKYLDSKFDLIANLLLCAESHCAFFIKPGLPKWTKVPATLQELLKSFPPKLESVYKAFDKSQTEYTEISARRNELWRHALGKMNTAIVEELGHHGNNHKSQSSDDDYQSPLVSAAKDYSKIVRAFVDTIMKSVGSLSTEISAIILEWKQAECGLEQGEYPNYSKSEVIYLKGIMVELWNAVSDKDVEKCLALLNGIKSDCSGDHEDTDLTDALLFDVMIDAEDYEGFQQKHGENINRQWQEFGNNPHRRIFSSDNEERGLRWKRGREEESHHFDGEGDTTEQSRKRARGWGRGRE